MSRGWIFAVFILVDLAIVGGAVWCAFQRMPAGKYLVPAIVLFVFNGVWLVMMTLRNMPPRQ